MDYREIHNLMKGDFTLREVYVNGKPKQGEPPYSFSKSKKNAEGYETLSRDEVAELSGEKKQDAKTQTKTTKKK